MLPDLNNYRFARNKNTDSLLECRLSDGRVVYMSFIKGMFLLKNAEFYSWR